MAAAAAAVGRANRTKSHNLLVLSSRFLSSTSGAGPWQLFTRRPPMVSPGCAVSSRFTPIRCWWNWCRFDPFAWFRFDPFASFDRCFKYWVIVMEKPRECASKKQIIDYYIETLAKVVGRYQIVILLFSCLLYYCLHSLLLVRQFLVQFFISMKNLLPLHRKVFGRVMIH